MIIRRFTRTPVVRLSSSPAPCWQLAVPLGVRAGRVGPLGADLVVRGRGLRPGAGVDSRADERDHRAAQGEPVGGPGHASHLHRHDRLQRQHQPLLRHQVGGGESVLFFCVLNLFCAVNYLYVFVFGKKKICAINYFFVAYIIFWG